MRFLGNSLLALFLTAMTLGLLAWAGQTMYTATRTFMEDDSSGRPARERVLNVNVIDAVPSEITPVLTAFGEIEARSVLEVRAPVAGRVVDLAPDFQEGGSVAQGDVLLSIDPTQAETAIAVAQADLRGAQAEVRDAARGLELAQAELAGARVQRDLQAQALQRQRDLDARNVGTAAAVEAAELALANAEQTILTRRGALVQAEARIETADLAQERAQIALDQAQRDLADRTLLAEFSGQLSDVAVLRGGLVGANEHVATLINLDVLDVAFRLSATQHARLLDAQGDLVGAPVAVSLDVFGLELTSTGQITREAPAVGDGQTGRLVFATLTQATGLRPGDFVRVRIEEPPLQNAIRLPATALSAQNRVLVLAAEDRLEEVQVTLLRRQDDDVLVRGPLSGRAVVAERTPVLGAGIKVRALRPNQIDSAAATPEMIALDPDRRARLISFLEGNSRMPPDVKERLLSELQNDTVRAAMVQRLEARMGG